LKFVVLAFAHFLLRQNHLAMSSCS
jgi:hypothetical protein